MQHRIITVILGKLLSSLTSGLHCCIMPTELHSYAIEMKKLFFYHSEEMQNLLFMNTFLLF